MFLSWFQPSSSALFLSLIICSDTKNSTPAPDGHILIPKTCEYVISLAKGTLQMELIEDYEMQRVSRCAQWNHKLPKGRDEGRRVRDVTMEAAEGGLQNCEPRTGC